MTPELFALAAAALGAQIGVTGYYMKQTPPGPRLERLVARHAPPPGTPEEGRAQRAYQNHREALVLFAIAILCVAVGDEGTWWTATLAWIYVAAHIAYVPAYIRGLSPGRSAIWAVGFFATVLLLLAAIF
jgi:uncharacterized MAPEG superfamily protein